MLKKVILSVVVISSIFSLEAQTKKVKEKAFVGEWQAKKLNQYDDVRDAVIFYKKSNTFPSDSFDMKWVLKEDHTLLTYQYIKENSQMDTLKGTWRYDKKKRFMILTRVVKTGSKLSYTIATPDGNKKVEEEVTVPITHQFFLAALHEDKMVLQYVDQ